MTQTNITAKTEVSEICCYLDGLGVDYRVSPDGLIRCVFVDGGELRIWQHARHEGDLAHLWAYCQVTPDGDPEGSGGLHSFAELTEFILQGCDRAVTVAFRGAYKAWESYDTDPGPALAAAREEAASCVPKGITGVFDDERLTFRADR